MVLNSHINFINLFVITITQLTNINIFYFKIKKINKNLIIYINIQPKYNTIKNIPNYFKSWETNKETLYTSTKIIT